MQDKTTSLDAVEYRVVGPPGCGKTTYLTEEVSKLVYSGAKLMVPLTKAAAAEIGGRGLPISYFGNGQPAAWAAPRTPPQDRRGGPGRAIIAVLW